MSAPTQQESPPSLRLLLKAWFSLTANERLAILVVVSLFLIGVVARAWHLSQSSEAPRPSAPIAGSASR